MRGALYFWSLLVQFSTTHILIAYQIMSGPGKKLEKWNAIAKFRSIPMKLRVGTPASIAP